MLALIKLRFRVGVEFVLVLYVGCAASNLRGADSACAAEPAWQKTQMKQSRSLTQAVVALLAHRRIAWNRGIYPSPNALPARDSHRSSWCKEVETRESERDWCEAKGPRLRHYRGPGEATAATLQRTWREERAGEENESQSQIKAEIRCY